jgi:hypothetical protein
LVFLVALIWSPPLEAAYQVTDLSFSTSPGETGILIATDGPAQQSYFIMDEEEPRLVIDLADAVHALGRYRFVPPTAGMLQRVRTSQYRPYPHPVVRIVLDLRHLVPFEVMAVDGGLQVMLQEPPLTPAGAETDDHTDAETIASLSNDQTEAERITPLKDDQTVSEVSPDNAVETVAETSPVDTETLSVDTAQVVPEPGSLMSRLLALGIRQPVSYSSGGRRDPFVPLPATQEVEFGQAPLPDVERLSIVGILQGIDGYRALAQDDADNGYVLRKGDRVLYGYVARIEAERVVFYLNRRGLDRTVILKIPQ